MAAPPAENNSSSWHFNLTRPGKPVDRATGLGTSSATTSAAATGRESYGGLSSQRSDSSSDLLSTGVLSDAEKSLLPLLCGPYASPWGAAAVLATDWPSVPGRASAGGVSGLSGVPVPGRGFDVLSASAGHAAAARASSVGLQNDAATRMGTDGLGLDAVAAAPTDEKAAASLVSRATNASSGDSGLGSAAVSPFATQVLALSPAPPPAAASTAGSSRTSATGEAIAMASGGFHQGRGGAADASSGSIRASAGAVAGAGVAARQAGAPPPLSSAEPAAAAAQRLSLAGRAGLRHTPMGIHAASTGEALSHQQAQAGATRRDWHNYGAQQAAAGLLLRSPGPGALISTGAASPLMSLAAAAAATRSHGPASTAALEAAIQVASGTPMGLPVPVGHFQAAPPGLPAPFLPPLQVAALQVVDRLSSASSVSSSVSVQVPLPDFALPGPGSAAVLAALASETQPAKDLAIQNAALRQLLSESIQERTREQAAASAAVAVAQAAAERTMWHLRSVQALQLEVAATLQPQPCRVCGGAETAATARISDGMRTQAAAYSDSASAITRTAPPALEAMPALVHATAGSESSVYHDDAPGSQTGSSSGAGASTGAAGAVKGSSTDLSKPKLPLRVVAGPSAASEPTAASDTPMIAAASVSSASGSESVAVTASCTCRRRDRDGASTGPELQVFRVGPDPDSESDARRHNVSSAGTLSLAAAAPTSYGSESARAIVPLTMTTSMAATLALPAQSTGALAGQFDLDARAGTLSGPGGGQAGSLSHDGPSRAGSIDALQRRDDEHRDRDRAAGSPSAASADSSTSSSNSVESGDSSEVEVGERPAKRPAPGPSPPVRLSVSASGSGSISATAAGRAGFMSGVADAGLPFPQAEPPALELPRAQQPQQSQHPQAAASAPKPSTPAATPKPPSHGEA